MAGEAFSDLLTLWHGFGGETKGALIGAASSIAVAAIGVVGIIRQIRKQGELNRENVAESERRRLKAKMYEEVEAQRAAVSEASTSFTTSLMTGVQGIQIAARARAANIPYPEPRARIPEWNQLFYNLQSAATDLIFLVERRRFIEPRIEIFRVAINTAIHDLREGYQNNFFREAMPLTPTDRAEGGTFPYVPPSPEVADDLFSRAAALSEHAHDVLCYAEDFLVEMQNLLLGDLFGKSVSHRVPNDPNHRVIRLADADELERHFIENTAWGRWFTAEEAKAVATAKAATEKTS